MVIWLKVGSISSIFCPILCHSSHMKYSLIKSSEQHWKILFLRHSFNVYYKIQNIYYKLFKVRFFVTFYWFFKSLTKLCNFSFNLIYYLNYFDNTYILLFFHPFIALQTHKDKQKSFKRLFKNNYILKWDSWCFIS